MNQIETAILKATEYRRDGDSDWEPLTEAPSPVRAAITEEIAEACYDRRDDDAETGTVSVGGVKWEYRRA